VIPEFQAALDASLHTAIHFHRRRSVRAVSGGPGDGLATTGIDEGGTVRCVAEGGAPATVRFATPEGAPRAVRRAAELARSLRREGGTPRIPMPARHLDRTLVDAAPWTPGVDQVRAFVEEIGRMVRGQDRRIVKARVRQSVHLTERWVVTTDGVTLHDMTPVHDLVVVAIAEEDGTVERAIQSQGSGAPLDRERGDRMARSTAEAAIDLLTATPLAPGRYPVVLAPAAAALLAHRALGHALGGAPGVRPLPVGTRLGPETLTLGDDGTVPGLRGTLAVDDEGTPGQNTTLIRNGVVVGTIHSRESAAVASPGDAPTGNMRTADPGTAPGLRLTNTYIAAGQSTLPDLIGDVSLGVYGLEAVGCRGDHGLAGLRLTAGRLIRNGALAEPVKDLVISTSLRECLGRIEGVGADFQWDLSASWCQGGGLGLVPVTVGAPHIRLIDLAVNDLLGGRPHDRGGYPDP